MGEWNNGSQLERDFFKMSSRTIRRRVSVSRPIIEALAGDLVVAHEETGRQWKQVRKTRSK
jgi:hypothetical protein